MSDIYTEEWLDRREEELKYWEKLSNMIDGWSVLGWSYRQSVTYRTGEYGTISMSGAQRDDIVNSVESMLEAIGNTQLECSHGEG